MPSKKKLKLKRSEKEKKKYRLWANELFELGYNDAKNNDHIFMSYMLEKKT